MSSGTATKIVMIGTGGHAQMMVAAARHCPQWQVLGWLGAPDPAGPSSLLDLPVWPETPEGLAHLKNQGIHHFFFGLGTIKAMPERLLVFQTMQTYGLQPCTLIHPTAFVDPTSSVGPGSYVGAGVIIQPFAHIGSACIVNTGAVVEHHVTTGPNVHIAPNSTVCGGVTIGSHTLVGAGAVIRQSLTIGEAATIGAGVAVIKDVPPRVVVTQVS